MSEHEYDLDAIDRAIYETVREYRHPVSGKRGGSALAPVMGMEQGTLLNKANPNSAYAHLSVKEARQVMLASGDCRILFTLANEVGYVCVPVPSLEVVGDLDVINALTEWQAEIGETAQKVRDIYADKVVKRSEVEELRKELDEDYQKGMALLNQIAGQAEPDEKVVPMGRSA